MSATKKKLDFFGLTFNMTNPKPIETRILIVDDEPVIRQMLCEILSEKYSCTDASCAEEALLLLEQQSFNLILSDIEMSGMSGIEMIPPIHQRLPDAVVILISGKQNIESAIEAMRVGAFDYIQKPFDLEHIEVVVERAMQHHQLLADKRRHENYLEELINQRTERLNYLAYYDALTDLPNRALFEDRLSQCLGWAQRNRKNSTLILFSIDRLKKIQDTLGHSLSCEILQDIARRLKKCVSGNETLARFEGDEFALLLPQVQNTKSVIVMVNNISEALKHPIVVDKHEVFITLSTGISFFPEDGEDAQELLKNASVALSRAKEHGGNSFEFYTADMNAKALRRLEMENNLRRAVEREEFRVYYQPKIDTNNRQIIGVEALVRWQHPELGLISPAEFIPVAEETGLIFPIGEWILQTACKQGKLWQDKGFSLNLSINLSARQFGQKNLSETIIRVINETGFDSRRLELEVTESSVMENPEYAVKVLSELKAIGIKFSIDDFGTGYSSLAYLKSLPIDIIKIDKSFISDITTNDDDATLVLAIITLAHNLRLKVIAEGVETEEQLKILHLINCDAWQGYLFSKPVPAEEFEKLLMKKREKMILNS